MLVPGFFLQLIWLYSYNAGNDAIAYIKVALAMVFDGALLIGDWYSEHNLTFYNAGQEARIHPIDKIVGKPIKDLPWNTTIISLDVENAAELAEVGLAWTSLSDVRDTAPGKNGINWHQHIHARHFRNERCPEFFPRKFLVGCPEHFQHGRSE